MSTVPDLDGDSAMLSSSSASSDAMFPSANDPPTPQNIQPLDTHTPSPLTADASASRFLQESAGTMDPGSELSPPASQDFNATIPMGDMMDMTEHASTGGAGVIELGREGGRGGVVGGREENEPGWGWKNKRAQEDWGRALEMVVDRGFSLREFGDLYDERVTNWGGGLDPVRGMDCQRDDE